MVPHSPLLSNCLLKGEKMKLNKATRERVVLLSGNFNIFEDRKNASQWHQCLNSKRAITFKDSIVTYFNLSFCSFTYSFLNKCVAIKNTLKR